MSRKKKTAPGDDEEEYGPFTAQDYIDIIGYDPWEGNPKLANPAGVKRTFVDPRVMLERWGRIDDYPDEAPDKNAPTKRAKESKSKTRHPVAKEHLEGSKGRKSSKKPNQTDRKHSKGHEHRTR